MDEVGVTVEKMMQIIGHHDTKSYAKYQTKDTEVDDKVCYDVIFYYNFSGHSKGCANWKHTLGREGEVLINKGNCLCFLVIFIYTWWL
jgi:hypothetical protein